MSVLIVTPSASIHGGISNYFDVLKGKFTLDVDYFIRGLKKDYRSFRKVLIAINYFFNIFQFIFQITTKKYKLIHLNTSLARTGLVRDGIYLLLAKLFNKKVIVFFHGLNIQMQQKLEKDKLFKKVFFKADALIVLSSGFKGKLIRWGYQKDIHLETTVIDEKWVEGLGVDFVQNKFAEKGKGFVILFVSRIIKEKGIYELLDGFLLLNQKHPDCSLIIVGDGKELGEMKQYSNKKKIKNVEYTGFLEGEAKFDKFNQADVFILPSYTEGMPTVIIEAMAFGLPVIASRVGGIPDLIVSDDFGLLLGQIEPDEIKETIELLLNDPEKRKRMARHNYTFAQNRLTANKFVQRLEHIYKSTINN